MDITWLGTASLIVRSGECEILFDPFITLRGAEFPNGLDYFVKKRRIYITHGHFDHMYSLLNILKEDEATVYCTSVPEKTLVAHGISEKRINVIKYGDIIADGNMEITVLKGKHVRFDLKIILKTLLNIRMVKYRKNLAAIVYLNRAFREGKQTVCFKIECENKTALLLGSLGIDETENYPENIDLLLLPFQGSSKLTDLALEVVDRVSPRCVFLHHFDDAFPPISSRVSTAEFIGMMDEQYPGVKVITPEFNKSVTL